MAKCRIIDERKQGNIQVFTTGRSSKDKEVNLGMVGPGALKIKINNMQD